MTDKPACFFSKSLNSEHEVLNKWFKKDITWKKQYKN